MREFSKGDRVTVTFEATVRDQNPSYMTFSNDEARWIGEVQTDAAVIEKIEPPVETFKSGDVVRGRSDPEIVVALFDGGYVYVGAVNNGLRVSAVEPMGFTSDHWERVSLD